jgi:hypothetical protein
MSCYTVPAMKAIRYGIHFTSLAVAAVIFWLVRDLRLPLGISNFNFLHYALMGALHATSIVVSLRGRRTALRALGFITLATVLSAWTPLLGLWGSIVWAPLDDILRERGLGAEAILVTGSVIGALGYWLLVQLFWCRSRRRASWFWAVAFCATSTLLVELTLRMFGGYDLGVAKADPEAISAILTFGWWLAFSASLYWSEMSEHTSKSVQAVT